MKRFTSILSALALVAVLLAPRADAQVQFVPYLGYDFDIGDGSLLVGVGAEFGILPGALPVGLALRPSAEYYFVDTPPGTSFDFFQINADVIAELPPIGPGVGLFAGAGLGLGFVSFEAGEFSDSSTEFGVNFLGGLDIDTGFVSPFVQARLTLMDGTRFGILGGVKLAL